MKENKDHTRICFLFPGQGSQFVGMGKELYAEFDSARQTYERASEALGYDMAALCFEGPEHELTRTDICQPAILTTSIAAMNAMKEAVGKMPAAAACAGLSLGEYSALVAAGSLKLADAVKLTSARGTFMQEACDRRPGTMYSIIGLDMKQVEDICRRLREDMGGAVWPANYNSPSQLVISGDKDSATEAALLCEAAGARRTIELKVAGAFHTPLMAPADSRLGQLLSDIELKTPDFPVIANVTAEPCASPQDIRELLARQITEPVRWMQSIKRLRHKDITGFLEIGPGNVLSGLLRRIDRSLSCTVLLSPLSIHEWVEN